jgi:hypothetical protein
MCKNTMDWSNVSCDVAAWRSACMFLYRSEVRFSWLVHLGYGCFGGFVFDFNIFEVSSLCTSSSSQEE